MMKSEQNELELLMLGNAPPKLSSSDGSSTCSDLTCESQSSRRTQRTKVLQIPHEWIHGRLPTDKEYGRWIKAQMSASEYDDDSDDEITIGCWTSSASSNGRKRRQTCRHGDNGRRDDDSDDNDDGRRNQLDGERDVVSNSRGSVPLFAPGLLLFALLICMALSSLEYCFYCG